MNIIEYNRQAWNRESNRGGDWSTPVDAAIIDKARTGSWQVILTPTRPVPAEWFGELVGKEVLCLASGGGQQAPILAAAGANVTSYDLSEVQLAKDRFVAERDALSLHCIRGDMRNLAALADDRFDLIFHPVANLFVDDIRPVWRECFRVLRKDGALLSGMMNPWYFLFDHEAAERGGVLEVKYRLPFSTLDSLDGEAKRQWLDSREAVEFSHSLDSQIGGQLDAGFMLAGFYEDRWTDEATPLNRYAPIAFATRAVKPENPTA